MRPNVPPSPARRLVQPLLALAIAGVALGAAAAPTTTAYSCRDDEGRVITSDRPVEDCADRPLAVHGADGRVKREIDAPPTDEDAQQQAEDAARQRVHRRELQAQSQRDRVLVEQYRTVEAVERARSRELAVIEQRAALLRARIRVAEEHLRENEHGARPSAGDGKARQLASVRGDIADDRAALAALDKEAADVRRRFDADAQRLRALRAAR